MDEIGLTPSTTGRPGGKRTGQSCSHYIDPEGRFARAVRDLLAEGFTLDYVDVWATSPEENAVRKKKAASKTKYTCPGCGTNAWAKPGTPLMCGDCTFHMRPPEK